MYMSLQLPSAAMCLYNLLGSEPADLLRKLQAHAAMRKHIWPYLKCRFLAVGNL